MSGAGMTDLGDRLRWHSPDGEHVGQVLRENPRAPMKAAMGRAGLRH